LEEIMGRWRLLRKLRRRIRRIVEERARARKMVTIPEPDLSTLGVGAVVRPPTLMLELPVEDPHKDPGPPSDQHPDNLRLIGGI
jgi:hypothetical protein